MNRTLILSLMIPLSVSGWLAAALLWFRAPRLCSEGKPITTMCSSPKRFESAPVQQMGQNSQVANGTTVMEVYVRPHPPDFVTGRRIRFQSYTVFHDGEVEKIRFVDGDTITVVDSEAVDWPQQTRIPTYR